MLKINIMQCKIFVLFHKILNNTHIATVSLWICAETQMNQWIFFFLSPFTWISGISGKRVMF